MGSDKNCYKNMVVPEKKVQIELQYDLAILFMNRYPKELKAYPKEI